MISRLPKFFLALIAVISLNVSLAQENLLDPNYYGFEGNGTGWWTDRTEYWSYDTDSVASGNYSLKFSSLAKSRALHSFDTGKTITKVRSANNLDKSYIVATSYEGTVLGIRFDGTILWENPLSAIMNHDLWCEDITGDGIDEILVANADGNLYCLNSLGEIQWQFKPSTTPMYSVCVLNDGATPYVVCGGYDKSIYYLSSTGALVTEIESSVYSVENVFGDSAAPDNTHISNFIRKIKQTDGTEKLVVHGVNNSMQNKGSVYILDILGTLPTHIIPSGTRKPVGDLRVVDIGFDGTQEILLGTSTNIGDSGIVEIYPDLTTQNDEMKISDIRSQVGSGYRVAQPEIIADGESYLYFILYGSEIVLLPPSKDWNEAEVLHTLNAYNDMWKIPETNKFIFASAQSGGSSIHILNTEIDGWKTAYESLIPQGKIQSILDNTQAVRDQLATFQKPTWENPEEVVLISEKITSDVTALYNDIKNNYSSPVFLKNVWMPEVENWDRSTMANEVYKNKFDSRKDYVLTSQEVLNLLTTHFATEDGISYWGGHGNDPYMISLPTLQQVVDAANGQPHVMIYPELEQYDSDFAWVMDDLFYPLASYSQGKNSKIYVRTKHTFWQGIGHLPLWDRMKSGEFADVFVPSMEETTDKSMDLSIAGKLGYWMSGAVNSWGARGVRDNASFDRLRQHSQQEIPNNFLRLLVYNISYGAQYINNFAVDQEYMSLLWELIAKGALYVPEKDEILSFSPVHLSMRDPDLDYIKEGKDVKWLTYFDEDYDTNNKFVFSRLNGSWPGAQVTDWDFSNYAAGVKDRRLNFLPTYENGMVLITPPTPEAGETLPRGEITDHMHPLYSTIMKEYYTDGRHYYSQDGLQQYDADVYYQSIQQDIEDSALQLPITVTGDVAWVVAQTSPTHLRLTIIDNGYINPDARSAQVTFNNSVITPIKVEDILDGTQFSISNSTTTIDIPCGMFRFLDIELANPL